MAKSSEAFRTISEVSDWLETPAHVLRFWESRFSQIKPVKRAGGRRYYRPGDMALLGGIKRLLHDDGITIKGVQKILREKGVKYVGSLSLEALGGDGSAQPETDEAAQSEQTPIDGILAEPTTPYVPAEPPAETVDSYVADPAPVEAETPSDYVEPIIFAGATTPATPLHTAHAPLDQDDEQLHHETPDADVAKPAVDTAPAPAQMPVAQPNGQGPTAQPAATGHEDRITALYSRLAALRDRVNRDMVNG